MSEPPFLFLLFLAGALLLAALDEQRLWMFPAAGAVIGLAYLTRNEAIAFFGGLLIFALVWLWTSARSLPSNTWYAVGWFALSFMLVASPYIWYLHVHTGQWMISGKLHITWKAGAWRDEGKTPDQIYNNLDSAGVEINWLSSERFQGNVLTNAMAHPGYLLKRVIRSAGSLKENFFTRTNFWWVLMPLVILGLFKQPWSRQRFRYEAFLITIIVVLLVVFLPFGFAVRFFAPAFPILLMWTAKGALELGQWCQDTVMLSGEGSFLNRYIKAGLRWLPGGMTALALVLTTPVTADRAISATCFGDKEAGLWLKTHVPDDAKVMSIDIAAALYAGRAWVPSPNTDWARFMNYATMHGAQYLIVGDFMLEQNRPGLAAIVRSGAAELELIHKFEEPFKFDKITTYIYRIVKPS